MKRALIFLLILAVPALLTAQTTGLTSVESDFSQGLFPNELDAALNVGPEFFNLNMLYLFGGVGNLNKTTNVSSIAASAGNPIWLGMFMPASTPYSLFLGSYFNGLGGQTSTTTVVTQGAPVVVTTGTDDVEHQWIAAETVTTNRVPMYQRLYQQAQYLTILGAMNLGLYLGIDFRDDTTATSNRTVSVSEYDNNAGAAVPVADLDYTRNYEYRNFMNGGAHGINNTITLKIPFYMEIGGTQEHTAVFGAGYNWTDGSQGATAAGNAITETLANVPHFDTGGFGGTFTETVTNLETRKTNTLGIDLDYDLALPGLFNCNAANRFTTGISASLDLLGANYGSEYITQDHDYTVGGTTFVDTTRYEDITTIDVASTLNYNAELRVNHSFYYQLPGMAEFGIKPSLAASYNSSQADPNLASVVTTDRTDGNADGAFTDATDVINVSTYTFSDTMIGENGATADKVRTNDITITTSLPSSLKIQPEKWWFGFIIGATPACEAIFSSSTTGTSVFTQRDHTEDGTGTAAGNDTVTNADINDPVTTKTTTYNVTLDHNFGVFFDFTENVHLAVDISATFGGGVWDLDQLIVQGIIRLPHTPREKTE